MRKYNSTSAASPAADENKKRKKSLAKFGILAFLSLIIWILSTIAWFAMNNSVGANNLGVTLGYGGFELRVSDENEGTPGAKIAHSSLYSSLDSSLSDNTDFQTSTSHDTIRWRVAGSDDKLRPGAQGELRFKIISTGADINALNYRLEIEGYSAITEIENNVETITGLTKIVQTDANTSQTKKDGVNYLKHHLMFFTSREGESEEEYQYNGFISDISDFTLTPNANNEAVIYWIWPNTFGQIALDYTLSADLDYLGSGAVSVLNSSGESNDRNTLTNYLKTNQQYIFKGTNNNYSNLIETLYSNRSASTSYHIEYEKLSGGYNAADIVIGQNVDFVSVLLNATAS